ncbi:MAG: polysaccharide deacetylase family protein [Bacilli bacterium]|nr:polysaccharide deacetylase family protein [Bacilli bacterium]
MKKSRKKKLKYKNIIIVLVIIIAIVLIPKLLVNKEKELKMTNLVNKNYNDIVKVIEEYNIDIKKNYEYSDEIEKDYIISQSIEENKIIAKSDILEITISRGKLDKEKLKNDNINELGRVPIMMYHGIKDMKNNETSYTGGNVDKDGYTRTSEAFRNDLEFYYQEGYRMIKLSDYINGKIDVEYGKSPIILTFDDGNANNIKVTGVDSNGNIVIDPNSAVGILEEYKKKYKDFNVTAIFFLTNNLFNQPEYDEKIINWLINNGYEVGNHTQGHNNFTTINEAKTEEVVGYMYEKLDEITNNKSSKIIALPYGSPYNKTHKNYNHILEGLYNGTTYKTEAALRVGWEPEISPFNKEFDKTFLKRCRAYDNNGLEFDIKMVFKNLEKTRYISDGEIDRIVIKENDLDKLQETNKETITY